MNEFWLMGSIIAWIVFLIFMMLPATEERYIEMPWNPGGDWIEGVEVITILWIWAIRILSLIAAITFALLYFL